MLTLGNVAMGDVGAYSLPFNDNHSQSILRSLTQHPELIDVTPLCVLEARSAEVTVHIYLPDECKCKEIVCDKNLTTLEPHKMTILNWGIATKQRSLYERSPENFLSRAISFGGSNRKKYPGTLIIDEIQRGIPMWWRFSDEVSLSQFIYYLRNHLNPENHSSKRTPLLISLEVKKRLILNPQDLSFLQQYFELVEEHDDLARGFFVRSYRTMMNEIHRLELQDPIYIDEAVTERFVRTVSKKIASVSFLEFVMASSLCITMYYLRKISNQNHSIS